MSFVLRIFLSGLVALVPSENGEEVAVVFLDAREGYTTSTGGEVPPHYPLLLARAGECESSGGECPKRLAARVGAIAEGSSGLAASNLANALEGGLIWQLDREDISFRTPSSGGRGRAAAPLRLSLGTMEGSEVERARLSGGAPEEFSWVVRMDRVAPGWDRIDPELLAARTEDRRIVARTRLSAGNVRVHQLVRSGNEVTPVTFKTLEGTPSSAWAPQPVADWLVVDVEVPGCEIEILGTGFGESSGRRSARLRPRECGENGVVEVAMVNLPAESYAAIDEARHRMRSGEAVGSHFEIFFGLTASGPVDRPFVPHASAAGDWSAVLPQPGPQSTLLRTLLPGRRGSYSQPICPFVQFRPSPEV